MPPESVIKIWLPVDRDMELMVMRSVQLFRSPSRVRAEAVRTTSLALASILSRCALMTYLRPIKIKAEPSMTKLRSTIAAVEMKFLK